MISDGIIIAIISIIPGILAAVIAYRKAVRANDVSNRNAVLEIEAGAYKRARELYEAGIKQLEDQVHNLRQQLTDEQNVSSNLRQRINEMEETISRLRQQLINAGIELAPHNVAFDKD